MKKIDFPQPVHEQAVEILEEALKKIEALGFKGRCNGNITSDVNAYAVFEINLSAAIEC